MKIVNVANDVSTAVVNVNASDTNETSTKMMTARMNMLLENRECSKPLSMGRNLPQILCATESDVESVSRNLLMLLVRFRYSLDDFSMQRNLRFWKSKSLFDGAREEGICTFGEHSVLHTSGLRAIWFTALENRSTTSGLERRKKTKFCIALAPLFLSTRIVFEYRMWILLFFVLQPDTTDHKTRTRTTNSKYL